MGLHHWPTRVADLLATLDLSHIKHEDPGKTSLDSATFRAELQDRLEAHHTKLWMTGLDEVQQEAPRRRPANPETPPTKDLPARSHLPQPPT